VSVFLAPTPAQKLGALLCFRKGETQEIPATTTTTTTTTIIIIIIIIFVNRDSSVCLVTWLRDG
jgi:hypothetical protein